MQVIHQVFKQNYFKSVVAFFFLFFFQGNSIVTRQQGISYNIESTNVKTKNKHLNKHEKKTKNK